MADRDLNLGLKISTTGADSSVGELNKIVKAAEGIAPAAADATAKTGQSFDGLRGKAQSIQDAIKVVGAEILALAAIPAAGELVRDFARISDQAKELEARIKLAAGAGADYAAVQQQLFEIAQRSQQPVAALGELYARIAPSLRALGLESAQTLQFTETLAKTFRISGAGAAEANAAIIQLSQGLAAGALRGDEFNSVAEQSPRLMQALADGLGVTRGELRKMAEEGKLSAEVVSSALLGQSAVIEEEFGQLPQTIGGAVTKLQNEVRRLVGEIDKGLGPSSVVIASIDGIASHLDELARVAEVAAVGGVATLTKAMLAKVNALREGIAAAKLAKEAALDQAVGERAAAQAQLQSVEGILAATNARLRLAEAAHAAARAELERAEAAAVSIRADVEAAAVELRRAHAMGLVTIEVEAAAAAEQRLATVEAELAVRRAALTKATAALAAEQTAQSVATATQAKVAEAAARAEAQLETAQAGLGKQTIRLKDAILDLNNALNLAFAAYVGFEIGTYLYDEFEIARKAGAYLTEALLRLAETARFAFDVLTSPLDIGADWDEHAERLRQIAREFDEIRANSTDAAIAEQRAAEQSRQASEQKAVGVRALRTEIKGAADDAAALALKSDEATKKLAGLGAGDIAAGITRLQAQLKQAKDEIADWEARFDAAAAAGVEAFAEFEKVNREAFGKASQRVVDLGDGIQRLRDEQFKRLGVDAGDVLDGIDAKAKDLLTTFRSLVSDPQSNPKLLTAAFKELLATLDSPQELESLKASLKGVQIQGFDTAGAIAEIDKQLKVVGDSGTEAGRKVKEAFAAFGIQTRAELEVTAQALKDQFQLIQSSGQATAAGLDDAFSKMADAQLVAAGGLGKAAQEAQIGFLAATAATDKQREAVVELIKKYELHGDTARRVLGELKDQLADVNKELEKEKTAIDAVEDAYQRRQQAQRDAAGNDPTNPSSPNYDPRAITPSTDGGTASAAAVDSRYRKLNADQRAEVDALFADKYENVLRAERTGNAGKINLAVALLQSDIKSLISGLLSGTAKVQPGRTVEININIPGFGSARVSATPDQAEALQALLEELERALSVSSGG